MKSILTLISCLILSSACAETIDNVEYNLPKNAKDWKIGNQMGDDRYTMIIYVPNTPAVKGAEESVAKEAFGVVVLKEKDPSKDNDISLAKQGLTKMMPNLDIDFKVLEKAKDGSGIYEWSASDNGKELVHGWGRAIITKDGIVTLSYQTENTADVDKARETWLPVLKNAHLK